MIIEADYIFVDGSLLQGKYVEVTNDGTIVSIGDKIEHSDTEEHQGILIPGMFNCHTHLELAGSSFEKADGLMDFLSQMKNYYRSNKEIENIFEIQKLNDFFYDQGIHFCADILNTEQTLSIKKQSKIKFYNFIEFFYSSNVEYENKMHFLQSVFQKFRNAEQQTFLCPHSLYSISSDFVEFYKTYLFENKNVASIHFKETLQENNLKQLQRDIYNTQINNKLADFHFDSQHQQLIQLLNQLFEPQQRILFVHAIYMNDQESDFICKTYENSAICICPTSNIFIEKAMAEKSVIEKFQQRVFLGTDSQASNTEMSFVKEMFLFQQNYKTKLEELIKMVSQYPAEFFLQKNMGKIKPGMKPGLVLLKSVDYKSMSLTNESKTIRLM